jgi:hypothetical protein
VGGEIPVDNIAFLTYAVQSGFLGTPGDSAAVKVSREREGRQAYITLRAYKQTPTNKDIETAVAI